ncbi:DUF3311 domain-containing protein [Halostella sp. JP-L12]|uniref:DUF3311 domain-containing protein n=1 Tax=Halostella TaxID=1843185 RepID=UPI000EF802FB|nr:MULTISPECIES: DUF3311 domain-containing protein [Halostella]NHN47095.1 DUF3311 domain-containing protein [Halostella sp. JP-L12]
MVSRTESIAWAIAFALLAVLAVPWFLWRDATVWAGLPVWVWWHVGWLALSAVVFAAFADRAWGVWVGESA